MNYQSKTIHVPKTIKTYREMNWTWIEPGYKIMSSHIIVRNRIAAEIRKSNADSIILRCFVRKHILGLNRFILERRGCSIIPKSYTNETINE